MCKKEVITPFSNGASFDAWKIANCYQCTKYEDKSTSIEEAGCECAFYLDLASVSSGELSKQLAEQIGLKNDALDSCCKLKNNISNNLKKKFNHCFFYVKNQILYERWLSFGNSISTKLFKVEGMQDINKCSEEDISRIEKNYLQDK